MAAVVASKVKRQRQLAAEQKNADTPGAESQLIQRRAASASREAAERRKLSQYYSQVEGDIYIILQRKHFSKKGFGLSTVFFHFYTNVDQIQGDPTRCNLVGTLCTLYISSKHPASTALIACLKYFR